MPFIIPESSKLYSILDELIATMNSSFDVVLDMLNRVEVRTIARPIDDFNTRLLKLLLCVVMLVTSCTILH